jgi:hypothetical protein
LFACVGGFHIPDTIRPLPPPVKLLNLSFFLVVTRNPKVPLLSNNCMFCK